MSELGCAGMTSVLAEMLERQDKASRAKTLLMGVDEYRAMKKLQSEINAPDPRGVIRDRIMKVWANAGMDLKAKPE